MTKQKPPTREDCAWEIYVQLVGNGRCTSYAEAAIGAFNAVEAFETQRTKRRDTLETNTVAASGDNVAQARAENAMKQSSDPIQLGALKKGEVLPDSPFGVVKPNP